MGPVKPLVKSGNAWVPCKDNSAIAKIEKQVKSLLNKITKEKFDRLSTQMCEIPIQSYEQLTLIIKLVYEKAIGEPAFSDMYANLCYRLSQVAKKSAFVKIIETDEDPHAEPGEAPRSNADGSVAYRWSNNVSTTDAEVFGPYDSVEDCLDVAMSEDNRGDDHNPRGDVELTLVRLVIRRGMFVKVMHSASNDKYYTVFFSASEAEAAGQQMSSEIFTSEIEAQNHAAKMNTFKRSLLNKCEDEFNKQDIYTDWKVEKKEYDKTKGSLSERDRNQKEEDLEFRRMKIKKQMLGNIKFSEWTTCLVAPIRPQSNLSRLFSLHPFAVGELYKLGMLKVKIMRFCIQSLLKLESTDDGGLRSMTGEDGQMDEEDHEALCNLFSTIGKTIDTAKEQMYMRVYFNKIENLSNDKSIGTRPRFMYKDLIEMRDKGWQERRKKETAKTIAEIRKEAEREERQQQAESRGGG